MDTLLSRKWDMKMLSFSGKVVVRRGRGRVATRWCSPSERGMLVGCERHRRKEVRLCLWL